MQHRWAMKPNIISRMGYGKKLKSDRGYEIVWQNFEFPSSPLPGIVNDHSLSQAVHQSDFKAAGSGLIPTESHVLICSKC